MASAAGRWVLVQPAELDPQIAALAGRRAGLQRRLRLLEHDPCDPELNAYRLSGPLQPIVCGLHLDRGYRLAFTTMSAPTADDRPRVVLLYVGRREAGHRSKADVWDLLHDIFGIDNPPAGHDKSPCCAEGEPTIEHDVLADFLRQLRRFNRGR
ncbi:MAG TPA: hypothetical protein VMD48_03935 [Solirubrobacteraceae bacterium]|nr:hypothetical protein [Solirubrobacteraceae bacterium]